MAPKQKGPPRLSAQVDLAEKGVTIGYELDPAKMGVYVAGLKMDNRSLVWHRDPVLTSNKNALFVVAVYTNKRDRPIYALYCRLRLSPRNRAMTSFVSRPILPGERIAFIFQVQRTIAPEVAHFNFSETASGLEDTGQAVTQHVPKQFLIGSHSPFVTGVGGGIKEDQRVIQADHQPDHFEAPSGPTQFLERAKNLGLRRGR